MRSIKNIMVSIVLPAYNEALNIPTMHNAITKELKNMGIKKYEIIFVNDGSSDDTVVVLENLGRKDKNLKAISVAFNVGHQLACYAGMKESIGDVVITMDADGQHPPSMFKQLLDGWVNGYEVVNTVRVATEKASFVKNITSTVYYFVLNKVGQMKVTPNTADFRLLTRGILNALLQYEDRDLFLRGLVAQLKCRQSFVDYIAPARMAGESKYSFAKMLRLAWNGIVNGSRFPLKLSMFLSCSIFIFALGEMAYELFMYFTGVKMPPGYMTLVILLSVYTSIILLILGILGSYIGKIYSNSKKQPLYVVSQRVNM